MHGMLYACHILWIWMNTECMLGTSVSAFFFVHHSSRLYLSSHIRGYVRARGKCVCVCTAARTPSSDQTLQFDDGFLIGRNEFCLWTSPFPGWRAHIYRQASALRGRMRACIQYNMTRCTWIHFALKQQKARTLLLMLLGVQCNLRLYLCVFCVCEERTVCHR